MIQYTTKTYSIRLDEKKGHISYLKMCQKECIRDTLLPLFQIQMRDEKGQIHRVNTYDGKLVSKEENGNRYTLIYRGFEPYQLEVIVYLEMGTEKITWRIGVCNCPEQYCLEWIDFPQTAVCNNLKSAGGESQILWGYNEGIIVEDIQLRESLDEFAYKEPAYPSEGLMGMYPAVVELQFMAYYDPAGGLYLGTHDADGYLKGIDFHSEGNGIKLQFRHFCGCGFGEDYQMDYDFVMQAFSGDWHDAAEIYRRWFSEHKNKAFVPIEENPNLPEWYKNSPVVVTYPVRGMHDMDIMNPNKLFPYVNALPHIERYAEETDSRVMALIMHWEGSAPWAPPYVWPPYGGEAALEQFGNRLHEKENLLGVYCSGISWTEQSNVVKEYQTKEQFQKEHLEQYMCVSPTGELEYSHICRAQRSGYDMCISQEFTKNVISDEVKHMSEAGIDYIQVLDQNHGGTPYFCYSRKHGHPPVPGKWVSEQMVDLLERLKKYTHADGRKVLLGCESAAAETYIPYLLFSDNRFNITYRFGGYPVPVYAYVFHQYVNNFMGNQVCSQYAFDNEKYPDNLLMRIAYAYSAGDMFTLVINEDGKIVWNWGLSDFDSMPDQENIIRFIKAANAYRRGYGKQYLNSGQMQKPLKIITEKHTPIVLKCGFLYEPDLLFTSRWKASDGSVGQFLINYNACSVKAEICTDRKIQIRSADGKILTSHAPRDGKVQLFVNPLDVVLFEEIL